MTRRSRRWIMVATTAAVTGLLVWLPTAAQAGISLNGID
jgi:hypothetical protein